jgi:hypothetical protein
VAVTVRAELSPELLRSVAEAGQLLLKPGRRFTLVEGDVDGDSSADFAIAVYLADAATDPLEAADFVL